MVVDYKSYLNSLMMVGFWIQNLCHACFITVQVIFILFFIFSICIVIKGLRYKKTRLNKYPEIKTLIEELDTNVVFKNSDFVMSEHAIAPLYHLESIIPYNDIIKIKIGGVAEGIGIKYRTIPKMLGQTFTVKTKNKTVAFLVKNRVEFIEVLLEHCNEDVRETIIEGLGIDKA